MAKEKQQAYDKQNLRMLVSEINILRGRMQNKAITFISADLDKLEEAIKMLPKKDRQTLEKFWGLIPGTINHSKRLNSSSFKDQAFERMKEETTAVIQKLLKVDYLSLFDRNFPKYYENILLRINKEGCEEVSDLDAIKYLMLFQVFVEGGQRLFEEDEEDTISLESEKSMIFDEYMLFKLMYEERIAFLPYESINLKLLIEIVSLFDTKDVVAMKKYARLPVKKSEDYDEDFPSTFAEIRKFKERIFAYGPWNIAVNLVYGSNVEQEEVEELKKYFNLFRSDFNSVWSLRKEDTISLKFSEGVKEVKTFQIGNMKFSDIDEMVALYVCKNLF